MAEHIPAIIANCHRTVPLLVGDALNIKAMDSSGSANVALTAAVGGVSFSPTATSGTTLLTVGPFSATVELTIQTTGNVKMAWSFAGLSAAV
jgi:hypothetical protein